MDYSDMFLSILGGGYNHRGFGRSNKPKKKKKDNWFEELNATQCKELAKAAKLKVSGSKNDLVQRLLEHEFVGRFSGTKNQSAKKKNKPKDFPKRPISAYNIFFTETRKVILKENEGKSAIAFQAMAEEVAARWKDLDSEGKARVNALADKEIERYETEVNAYHEELEKRSRLERQEAARKFDNTLAGLKEECKKRFLQVSGTKFDLVLRIIQHEHGTGGASLKRAATEMIVNQHGIPQQVAKKRKPNKPNPSTMYSRVSKKCQAGGQKKYQSNYGSKDHAPDVERLMRDLLDSLEPYLVTDPHLVLEGCSSIVSACTEHFDGILRPNYFQDLAGLADTIVAYAHQVRSKVSSSTLDQLATIMTDWNYKAAFENFDVQKYDMHEAAHKIRHGASVKYDKRQAKQGYTPPVGSTAWYEQAKKDGIFNTYVNGKLVEE